MRRNGNVRVLHAGFGWLVSWPVGGRQAGKGAESFFFCASDALGFDDLRERDPVTFTAMVPEPSRGPRAVAVRRDDASL